MVCKQCWKLGVRHIQLLLLFGCVTVGHILTSSHIIAVKLARETPTDTSTYYEDHFKIEMEARSVKEILALESSIYFVLFIARILSGIVCCKVNNKVFLLVIMLLFSIQSYTLPYLAQHNAWTTLIAMRIVVGLLHGLLMPVIYQIAARWSPFTESGRCIAFITLGPFCGRLFVTGLVGFIGRSIGGWTSVFYISGNLGILWVVAWFTFGADDPRNCFYLSLEEKYYIEQNIFDMDTLVWEAPIPWKKIFKSRSIYVAIVIEVLLSWTNAFYLDCSFMTTYARLVHGYSEREVGYIFHYMSIIVITPVMITLAIFCDLFNNKEIYPYIHQRKTCSSIGLWGSAICTLYIGFSEDSPKFVFFCFYVYVLLQPFVFVSFSILPFDIAPNFAGLIHAISTSIGSLPIMVLPTLVNSMVPVFEEDVKWNYIFYLTGLSMFCANFVYTIFFHGRLEDYNRILSPQFGKKSSGTPSIKSTYQFDSMKIGSSLPSNRSMSTPAVQK